MPKEETEEYLEAVHDLSKKEGTAKTTEISKRLKVAPASVTEELQRLSKEGMVRYRPYKGATLTEKGRALVNRLKRKHRLLEVLLTKVLRLAPHNAHQEACRLEHSLSDEAENALCKNLGGPESCPHGSPIPPCDLNVKSCLECPPEDKMASKRARRHIVPITALKPNERARVAFIRGGKSVVKRLSALGLTPGADVSLLRAAPMSGPIELCIRGCNLAVGRGIAEKIFVEPEGSAAA